MFNKIALIAIVLYLLAPLLLARFSFGAGIIVNNNNPGGITPIVKIQVKNEDTIETCQFYY